VPNPAFVKLEPEIGPQLAVDLDGLVTVKDDELETTAQINTERMFRTGDTGADAFLRAFINKKTGISKFQVYTSTRHTGEWHFYMMVNYETPDGPQSSDVTRIDQSVGGCSASRYGSGCSLNEDVGFDVEEPLLRLLVARATASSHVWRFRLKAKDGSDLTASIDVSEIAALLRAYDEYRLRIKIQNVNIH